MPARHGMRPVRLGTAGTRTIRGCDFSANPAEKLVADRVARLYTADNG